MQITIDDVPAPSEPSEAELQAKQAAKERGERTAENIRYGQGISESGMSGFTTGQEGEAKQGLFGTSSSSMICF